MSDPVLDGARGTVHPRKVLRCRAVLHLDDGASLAVRTVDVSAAGMSLVAQQSLPIGLACRVALQVPVGGQLVDLAARTRVMYNTCQGVDGFRLGVRFTDPDPARTRLIDRLY